MRLYDGQWCHRRQDCPDTGNPDCHRVERGGAGQTMGVAYTVLGPATHLGQHRSAQGSQDDGVTIVHGYVRPVYKGCGQWWIRIWEDTVRPWAGQGGEGGRTLARQGGRRLAWLLPGGGGGEQGVP